MNNISEFMNKKKVFKVFLILGIVYLIFVAIVLFIKSEGSDWAQNFVSRSDTYQKTIL